jgi:hypothetical protein
MLFDWSMRLLFYFKFITNFSLASYIYILDFYLNKFKISSLRLNDNEGSRFYDLFVLFGIRIYYLVGVNILDEFILLFIIIILKIIYNIYIFFYY